MRAFTESKKGETGAGDLKEILLALLGMIAAGSLIWYFFYGTAFADEASSAACHDALVYSGALVKQFPGGDYVKRWPTTCKTQERTIEARDRDAAINSIIGLVAECWYQTGEGKIHPFASDVLFAENKCFTCSTFSLPNLQEGEVIASHDLIPAMASLQRADGKTQYDYLVGSGITSLIQDPIMNDKIYAVTYASFTTPWIIDMLSPVLPGEQRPIEGIMITDLNKVGDKCVMRAGEAA